MSAIWQAAWVCVLERDLYGERTPAKIFINLSRKHVLKMKNKQMYKCSLREIHYVHLQTREPSMWETWGGGQELSTGPVGNGAAADQAGRP